MSYYRQGPFRPAGSGIPFGVPKLTPWVKYIIIGCTAVWLVQLMAPPTLSRWLGVVPALVAFKGFIWQPLTYIFLHGRDPLHLFFNMLMLWMFGGELERLWGGRAFLNYFLVCGAGGGVCATILGLIWGGDQALIPTIGASGAIFGIFVAYGIIFAERTVLFMMMFPMKARTMVMIFVGINFFYLLSTPGGGVSHIAHLGGALTGYLYLKRAWRIGSFVRELRWKLRRRKFKMIQPDDPDDRWIN